MPSSLALFCLQMNDAHFHPDDYQYGPRTSVVLEPALHQVLDSPAIENLRTILKTWDGAHRADGFDPLPTLTRCALFHFLLD